MTGQQLGLAAGAFMAVALGSPLAQADGCLQKFSCQLYGECRLPCLDEMLGQNTESPPPMPDALSSRAVARDPQPAKSPFAKIARSVPVTHKHLVFVRMVAGREATSLAQLAGKPVSFGPEGDPGQVVGRKIFAKLGIKVQETPLDLDNALDGIATGDVAAVLVFRERDAAKLQALGPTPLHLVPAPADAGPPAGMTTAVIPPGSKDAVTHGRAIRTFAVEADLSSALMRQTALR